MSTPSRHALFTVVVCLVLSVMELHPDHAGPTWLPYLKRVVGDTVTAGTYSGSSSSPASSRAFCLAHRTRTTLSAPKSSLPSPQHCLRTPRCACRPSDASISCQADWKSVLYDPLTVARLDCCNQLSCPIHGIVMRHRRPSVHSITTCSLTSFIGID